VRGRSQVPRPQARLKPDPDKLARVQHMLESTNLYEVCRGSLFQTRSCGTLSQRSLELFA